MPCSIYCILFNFGNFCDKSLTQQSFKNLLFYAGGHFINTCCGVESTNIYSCAQTEQIISKPVVYENQMQQVNVEIRTSNQENIGCQYNPNYAQSIEIQQQSNHYNNSNKKKNIVYRFCNAISSYLKK